jgi:hypothetical protein
MPVARGVRRPVELGRSPWTGGGVERDAVLLRRLSEK